MSVTIVYFIFADQDYEYTFSNYNEAVNFAKKMEKDYGVEVDIFERGC